MKFWDTKNNFWNFCQTAYIRGGRGVGVNVNLEKKVYIVIFWDPSLSQLNSVKSEYD